jgi:hypothetical protein
MQTLPRRVKLLSCKRTRISVEQLYKSDCTILKERVLIAHTIYYLFNSETFTSA